MAILNILPCTFLIISLELRSRREFLGKRHAALFMLVTALHACPNYLFYSHRSRVSSVLASQLAVNPQAPRAKALHWTLSLSHFRVDILKREIQNLLSTPSF